MMRRAAARKPLALCLLIFLAACAPVSRPLASPTTGPSSQSTAATATASVTNTNPAPVRTPSSTPSPTAPPTAAPAANTPLPVSSICSPLEGIELAELKDPDLLKTLFQAPRPGQDDGHHGVDFAYWSRGERTTMLGHPVLSVLNGRVAAVIKNRPPYGNAVIIETPLDRLPAGWLDVLPTPAPTVPPPGNVSCPADPYNPGEGTERSLYLLYAHLNQPTTLTLGQSVSCGGTIGEVGTTGRSVNPHLHLETRSGPSEATFLTMAHYDNAASEEEMRSYCAWRISGLFQLIDPMELLD